MDLEGHTEADSASVLTAGRTAAMPAQPAEKYHADALEKRLHDRGLTHLRVRKYGKTLIVESGPKDQAWKHFRLRRDTVHLWWLDMAGRSGRWERTPYRDLMDNLADLVMDAFGWTLQDILGNPDRTSDQEY